ncbi:MAG: VWA domain-containing protein [Gammaproteobacteria bacterium]|nr:VWA domain-containing protein [Gammaproteobacteria bacterium]MBT3722601.1 VWA domain-containing protein [Gammaproteobacteria bacterium]MBT4078185.1 VWA domain-containing protein [Gammaproteobacteria bacterium]MBT4193221.1 VWA domain-containing protein [Gammaproteobacteria bacterium]MBT4451068.1 VWA domain-containing protein [Gammaproteobacteria bacterium]
MSLSDLYWREPLWLVMILLPLLILSINRLWQRRQLMLFADDNLTPWLRVAGNNRSKRLPMLSLLICWIFLCVATAGPRSIKHLPEKFQAEPSTLIVIVDLSASMNARDSRPDRRSAAQLLLKKWLLKKTETLAVGIVLFAGHAVELLPVTTDTVVISHFINSLSDIRLPTAGNDLSASLKLAEISLSLTKSHRRLLVLTDGDIELIEQQKVSRVFSDDWANLKIQTSFIGIGEAKPVTVPNGLNGLVELQGRPVLSRLEAQWLKTLAEKPSNNYLHYQQASRQDLETILDIPPLRISRDTQQQVIWFEWFPLPLCTGLFMLFLSMLLNTGESGKSRPESNVLPVVMVLFLLTGYCLIEPVAYADDQADFALAQQALDQKKYRQASILFSQLDTVESYFGEGIACYRLKDYGCSKQAFSSAAWSTSNSDIRAKAVFNLANSYFFDGDYDQAVTLYRDAELLGIESELIALNMSYAKSMQAAIQRHIKHIKQSYKRALWKAATTGKRAPSLSEFVINNDDFSLLDTELNSQQSLYQPPIERIQFELMQKLGLNKESNSGLTAGRWIETDRVLPQSTAKMLNRLFEMELGINGTVKQPRIVEGKRKW